MAAHTTTLVACFVKLCLVLILRLARAGWLIKRERMVLEQLHREGGGVLICVGTMPVILFPGFIND